MGNFKNITEEYKIQIPIIQRDYAQGRTDPKASQIRENFLNSIYEALENNNSLHLDFIYGSIIKEYKYGSIKEDKFIPLDGQQRLTTLFLLHWYFGKKENKDIDYLKKFTYETRSSSREFSSKLVDSEIDFSDTNMNISEQIKDSSWFLAYWENDPTIQAMLTMIDAIHSKFCTQTFYDNLDNITFSFFELENFGLDDDLYIKMNARGKSLTDFENFKAKFEKYLSQIDKELNDEFSCKIDNDWTDFFWNYGMEDKSYLIDDFFMNYFNYVTEMLHYNNNNNNKTSKKVESEEEIDFKQINFEQIKSIYDSEENIKFLFQSLDKLPTILKSFKELFSNDEYVENKVCFFDEKTNILEKIILDPKNVTIQQKILLFIIIHHSVDYEINDSLKDLLRVTRNLTNRIRQRQHIKYTQGLRYDYVHSLLKLFLSLVNKDVYEELSQNKLDISNSGISKESLQYEVDKAVIIKNDEKTKQEIFRLEDFKYTKGDIHNLLVSEFSKLEIYNNAIREIFSNNDSSIIRSMLTIRSMSTIDCYPLRISWTILGDKFFFGKENDWEVILTASTGKLDFSYKDFFQKYFESYKLNNNSLEEIIESYLSSNEDRGWKYYFIKYPEMTSEISEISTDNNIYAWTDDFALEKMGGKTLNAYHLNPYINTVANKIDKSKRAKSNNFSYLELECNGLKIFSKEEGWEIRDFEEQNLKNLITKYNLSLSKDKDFYLLEVKKTEEKDRIEILSEFLTEIKENKA